ncbi:XRE family transcriptional regulator [Microlunatus spumicola]|uniref:XRE family transcriptional regulator n=1 Tax=Microlunatus spumicola TaxID=81499 RepID=A0ABP6Y9Z3_9ACTN
MARNWRDVRSELDLNEDAVKEERERLQAVTRAYRLAEIRKEQGLTQREVAKQLHVSQARVSRLEQGQVQRAELATVQAYVEALGGHVEVVADFGGRRMVLG